MKKSLFLIGALALAGLFASCQKENAVSPEQTAVEQKVITIDVQNGGKAEIEPLLALGESILNSEDVKKKDSELERLVKKVLKEFVSVVRSTLGAHIEDPVHSRRYIGDMREFGLMIDKIRQLSYNVTEGERNFLEIQLGDAADLKVGSFEILPVSNFRLAYNNNTLVGATGTELSTAATKVAYTFVEDALFVKFKFKGKTYLSVIFVDDVDADIRNSEVRDLIKNFEKTEVGFIYGYWMGWDENLIDLYEDIRDTEASVYDLPIDATVSFRYASQNIDDTNSLFSAALQYKDFRIGESVSGEDAMMIELGTVRLAEGAWRAALTTTDVEAGKTFVKDFITAQVFGCSQSESNALIDEFNRAFPACEENNRMSLGGCAYEGEKYAVTYILPLALGADATSGMTWKPAFGLNVTVENDTFFTSFSQFIKMSDGQKADFWKVLQNSHSYYRIDWGK